MKPVLAALLFCAAPVAAQVRVSGFETTQAIQTLGNGVPLVAFKPTVIRVYLDADVPQAGLKGELVINAGGQSSTLKSNAISVTPKALISDLRNDIGTTLNFTLPPKSTGGPLTLSQLTVHDASGGTVQCTGCQLNKSLTFVQVPPLRVKLVGFSFSVPRSNVVAKPRDLDFERTESWLKRAYPIAELVSERAILDGGDQGLTVDQLNCNNVNAVLSVIRVKDSGIDPRTHYYGLVPDDVGFMPGCSSGIPQKPDPSVVASGPSGKPRKISEDLDFSWDTDGSYADFYAGHELAHTFGRYHPGFCRKQGKDDVAFPYADGHLSDADDKYVGFDNGDQIVKTAALPGPKWTDLMTYCNYVWASNYTYEALIGRIQVEGASAAGPGIGATDTTIRGISIIASVNLTKKTGRIRDVSRVTQMPLPPAESEPRAYIRATDASEKMLYYQPVQLRLDTDIPEGQDKTALVNAVIPNLRDIFRLELILDNTLLDQARVEPAEQVAKLSEVKANELTKSNAGEYVAFIQGITEEETTDGLLLRWSDTTPSSTYSVQIGPEDGPLQTLAIAVKRKYYVVRKSVLDKYRGHPVKVVVSTNNLSRTQVVSQVLSIQ